MFYHPKILITIFLFLFLLPACAEKFYEQNLEYMIAGDIDGLIKSIEEEKDFSWDKERIKLGEKNSELYAIALLANGDLVKARNFTDQALNYYPQNKELKDIRRQIKLYELNHDDPDIQITTEEEIQLKIIDLFPQYLDKLSALLSSLSAGENSTARLGLEQLENAFKVLSEDYSKHKDDSTLKTQVQESKDLLAEAKKQKQELLQLINQSSNRLPYFPTRLEYLLEFHDSSEDKRAEKEALSIINSKRKELFLKTLDHYELAVAYRVLGILSMDRGRATESKKFFELSSANANKMRSLWLVEDIIINKPILKINKRSTDFDCVLPQWILSIQENFKVSL